MSNNVTAPAIPSSYRTTNLRLGVNQREAMRMGINSPSHINLSIDFRTLHHSVRKWLADRYGSGTIWLLQLGQPDVVHNRHLEIVQPDEQGFQEVVEACMKAEQVWVRWLI